MRIAYWADAEESETRRTKTHFVQPISEKPLCNARVAGEIQVVVAGIILPALVSKVECKHCQARYKKIKNTP